MKLLSIIFQRVTIYLVIYSMNKTGMNRMFNAIKFLIFNEDIIINNMYGNIVVTKIFLINLNGWYHFKEWTL